MALNRVVLLAASVAMAAPCAASRPSRPSRPSSPPKAGRMSLALQFRKIAQARLVFACRTTKPPKIDGVLDDRIWQRVPVSGVLADTVTGAPGAVKTTFKVCHDWDNLYVAFQCQDHDVWSPFTKRDQPLWEADVVEVFICPNKDRTHYYEFEVSPRNVVWDGYITNPKGKQEGIAPDSSWNCAGLRTAVRVRGTLNKRSDRDAGWTAEMAIPVRCIVGRRAAPGEYWRVNFYRIETKSKKNIELLAWSPTRQPYFHVPARFGRLVFWANEAPGLPPGRGAHSSKEASK